MIAHRSTRRRVLVVAWVQALGWLVGVGPAFAAGALPPAVWRAALPAEPWGLTADDHGSVVTTDLGQVLAFDATGHRRWQAWVPGIVAGSPAVDGDAVVVGTSSGITVLDRVTGAVRFEHAMGDGPDGGVIGRGLAMGGGFVFAGSDLGRLDAVDPRTGALRWSVQYPGAMVGWPRVAESRGLVVAAWHHGNQPAVRVLDLATGSLRWSTPILTFTATPVVMGDQVVIAEGDGDFHAQVRALDLATGAARWARAVPASFERAIEPAADGDAVAVLDHLGTVTVLARDGRERWQTRLDLGIFDTRVIVTARVVVVSTYSREVVVFDRATGRVRARGQPGGRPGVPIAIDAAGGRLLMALRRTSPPRVEARALP